MILLAGLALAQNYSFPSSVEDYGAFYPTAYVDHGGSTDWNCGGITYAGHGGSDFGGGSWTGMDEGRDITAAADGVVTATNDGEYDRCSTGDCDGGDGYGNYVRIQHADGKSTIYGHFKNGSVAVSVGDTVGCGQKIGEMGSSGYSTGPHVHFEVRNSGNVSEDPFDGPCSAPPVYWVDQGDYDGLPALVCADQSACAPVDTLACGETISARNDGPGSTTDHGVYGCDADTWSGAELAYSFATTLDESVTLSLTGLSGDLDLMLLSSPACDGTGCLGSSINSNTEDESMTFTATAGAVYTVVVDGYTGAVSDFQLSAACAGAYPGDTAPDDTGPADTVTPGGTSDTDRSPPGAETDHLPGALVPGDEVWGCRSGGSALLLLPLWFIRPGARRRPVKAAGCRPAPSPPSPRP